MGHLPSELAIERITELICKVGPGSVSGFATLATPKAAVKGTARLEADAGGVVPRLDLPKVRDHGPTFSHRDGATGVEDAPGGRIERARYLPTQDGVLPPGLDGRVGDRHRREQGLRVGV